MKKDTQIPRVVFSHRFHRFHRCCAVNVHRGLVYDIGIRAGLYAQTQCHTLRAASVKSVESVRKYHAWNQRAPFPPRSYMFKYVVLSKKAAQDCTHASRPR